MHFSPQVALSQCLISVLLLLFLVYWAAAYDRNAAVRVFRPGGTGDEVMMRSGRQAFKRLMIYFYMIGLPIFAVQGAWYAWIKYKYGFLPANQGGNPVSYHDWPEHFRDDIGPLQILLALAWAAEIVVHVEELMFFLHLIHTTALSRPWFRSNYFKITVFSIFASFGSTTGIIGAYWDDPLKGEAVLYLFCTSSVLLTSFAFFWVMYVFPKFLNDLRTCGGTNDVVVRLKGWHELNKIRIPARLIFGISIFILAVDGLTHEADLNNHVVWVDTLLLLGLFAFAAQAVITLLIFLPRSWAREVNLSSPSPGQGASLLPFQAGTILRGRPPTSSSSNVLHIALDPRTGSSAPVKAAGPFPLGAKSASAPAHFVEHLPDTPPFTGTTATYPPTSFLNLAPSVSRTTTIEVVGESGEPFSGEAASAGTAAPAEGGIRVVRETTVRVSATPSAGEEAGRSYVGTGATAGAEAGGAPPTALGAGVDVGAGGRAAGPADVEQGRTGMALPRNWEKYVSPIDIV
ncbi:hypothetical protein JCM10207_001952 [Rhodosporidiobolus poonsookiae]